MATVGMDDVTPLLAEEGGVRQRTNLNETKKTAGGEPTKEDWDPNLPYGGKVYLARKKKPDPWWVTALEVTVIICTVAFAYYAYYYFDHLHFNITHGYASLGYASAQHQVGQRYLHGKGVPKDQHHAMEWFKKASDQGHAHAAYNLAVGHLQGIRTDLLNQGESHKLIAHAAKSGVKEAHRVLEEVCSRGGCS